MVEASDGSEVVAFFDGQGPSAFSLQRPEGFVVELPTEEEAARGAEIELVDFESWLAKPGIEIVSEQQIEIDGYPARDLQVLATEAAAGEFGDVPLTPRWTMQSSDDISRRLVYVDVGDPSPLLITAEQPSESDGFEEAVEAMIMSIPSVVSVPARRKCSVRHRGISATYSIEHPSMCAPCQPSRSAASSSS